MIILITGVPGSGKTLYAVQLLEEYIQQNEFLLKTQQPPRELFADIDGLELPGVHRSPKDWREVPDGSVVVYDECQQKFGPDGAGRSSREDIQEFETHRHRGIDLILITQHPKLLHAHVRRLVGRHYHVFRMYGAETAKIFRRDGAMDIDKAGTLLKEDTILWSYPKKHYGKYKSATVHTHKRHLPAWLKRSILGLVVIVVLLGVAIYHAQDFFQGNIYKTAEPEPEPVRPGSTFEWEEPEIVHADPADMVRPRVACIWSSDSCLCYDHDRWRIQESLHQCQQAAAGPWDRLPSYSASTRGNRTLPPSVTRSPSGSEASGETGASTALFRF